MKFIKVCSICGIKQFRFYAFDDTKQKPQQNIIHYYQIQVRRKFIDFPVLL